MQMIWEKGFLTPCTTEGLVEAKNQIETDLKTVHNIMGTEAFKKKCTSDMIRGLRAIKKELRHRS